MSRVVKTPMSDEDVLALKAGDCISLNGVVYTARDAAHQRMVKAIAEGRELPFDPAGQVIYYVGPCPGDDVHPVGSCGPTTSSRMDGYAPKLLELGLKGMIGKGERAASVIDSMRKNKAVYLAAVGGAGAFLAQKVIKADIVAYPDLGPEAVLKLEIKDFPCVVAIDAYGGNLYDRDSNKGDTAE
ncbi:MAG: Fe-S-containing hydro-lyase [Candidatus Saccharibacteria bacterium]